MELKSTGRLGVCKNNAMASFGKGMETRQVVCERVDKCRHATTSSRMNWSSTEDLGFRSASSSDEEADTHQEKKLYYAKLRLANLEERERMRLEALKGPDDKYLRELYINTTNNIRATIAKITLFLKNMNNC